ncbi:WSC domain-containing protein 2 [Tolypocladium ophioglossoides CBS 100239]|uniref:WSC domain-containing protein 2 n=1 Tax=Tolypocladium ophioglossoides (strain CBS 100239) TaxID=1163406 RepID=A0A0L0N645_TOLOC|nr:WSC domain-containing protein 2 [Tolypocladium ophioglossoides CBS 100239]
MTFLLRLLLPLAALLLAFATAQQASDKITIYKDSQKYAYYGCYNETTGIDGSDHSRALSDGINEVKRGEMTVPMCLSFCSGGKTEYRYAGLEWSRECWCSQSLSGISKKLDDGQCNFPCEGDNTTACGGSLKLTVYRLSSASTRVTGSALLATFGVALTLFL